MGTGRLIALVPLVMLGAACGTDKAHVVASGGPPPTTVGPTAATVPTDSPSTSSGATVCATGGLSMKLGPSGAAAGSDYQPIVFTNTSGSTCTLSGYPGVSFVAPQSGHQVGAAASRNPQHPVTTVTLTPGQTASALLQIADELNYSPSTCKAVSVSGLRVYPPGSHTAGYVAFSQPHQACSTDVGQLSVAAVIAGSTGM